MRKGRRDTGRSVPSVDTGLLLDPLELEEWVGHLEYPCPAMLARHRYAERVLSEGGVLPKVVADFAEFTGPGPFANTDLPLGSGYCARLMVNTSGYPWDRAELTVGPESSIHVRARLPLLADELPRVAELHRSVAARVIGLHGIDRDPPEVPIAGGWSLRLTGGISGRRGRRVEASVGPQGGRHVAFQVQFPEASLFPMAVMYDELAELREPRVRRVERASIRMESAPSGMDPKEWAHAGRYWDGLVAEGCVTQHEADEAMLRYAAEEQGDG